MNKKTIHVQQQPNEEESLIQKNQDRIDEVVYIENSNVEGREIEVQGPSAKSVERFDEMMQQQMPFADGKQKTATLNTNNPVLITNTFRQRIKRSKTFQFQSKMEALEIFTNQRDG